MTTRLVAGTTARIRGHSNAWSVQRDAAVGPNCQDRDVQLEIQGSDGPGFHLVMSPQGCFTADTWHETLDEAFETAEETFGVVRADWETVE